MGAAAQIPGPMRTPIIEWRANRIEDPVARLRFLRQATRPVSLGGHAVVFLRRGAWRFVAAALACALFLIPARTPSRARGPVIPRRAVEATAVAAAPSNAVVWPVEHNASFDLYSNGLRNDTRCEPSQCHATYVPKK